MRVCMFAVQERVTFLILVYVMLVGWLEHAYVLVAHEHGNAYGFLSASAKRRTT